jgi:hypothetical protein
MTTGRLLGTETQGSVNLLANYLSVCQFTAEATGIVSAVRVYSLAAGNVKVAIYADDGADNAGALITANYNGQAVTANQWNTLSIGGTPVVQGTKYWLATIMDTNGAVARSNDSANRDYRAAAYSGFTFPDPAGGGWTAGDTLASTAGWGILVVSPSSISQPLRCGLPKLNLSLKPSGIAQPQAVGSPAMVTSAPITYPPGFAQAVDIGTPSLIYHRVISPQGMAQPASLGAPWIGIFGYVRPVGVEQQISIGSPTLLKYVWHVILDGRYIIESPDKNRIYIIGRDQYGNQVYGTAVDSTELGLVGERLDFRQEPAISTDSQAENMAGAVLSKMRLTGKRGVILIPPNCGQELFDVVQITDAGANREAVRFRVAGIRFEYDPVRTVYQHILILAAP